MYERDIQVRLQQRYRRLYKTKYDVYEREAAYFHKFIRDTPVLRAIVETLEHAEPELDADRWISERFSWQTYDWPTSEVGRAKVIWRLIERLASGDLTAMQLAESFIYDTDPNVGLRDMTETAIEPFIEYLEGRLGTESEVLYLLERLKHRIEAFDIEELYEAYKADTQRGEAGYDHYMRKFLFDQGLDPISASRSASGEADIVSGLESDDPLVEETKLYDGNSYNVAYVAKGFNQAVQYAQDHGKTAAHLIVVNVSDDNLHMPSDEESSIWPPRLHTSGVTVYMVVIRAKPLPSASRRTRQRTKTVARTDLIYS